MKSAWMLLLAVAGVSGCGNGAIGEAKKAVEVQLKDPSSVQWRDVEEYSEGVVCGEFNAKNSMGGYTGFKRFIFNGLPQDKTAQLLVSTREVDAFCHNGEGKRLAYLEKELDRVESTRQSIGTRYAVKYAACIRDGRGQETCEAASDLRMLKLADSAVTSAKKKVEEFKAMGK
jgi:hypothetical protein